MKTGLTFPAFAALLFLSAPALAQNQVASLADRLAVRLSAVDSELTELRRDIHRHPELSGQEVRTAALIADRLVALDFEVRTGVGGHGVIGVLKGGKPGPTVAFRADMDAVRSREPDPVDYRSLVPGVRHICGHDVHVAVGLGLAESFAAIRTDLPGTLMLVFQPAEETGTGAKAMLADGAFEALTPDAIYAVHTTPYPVGQLATTAGGLMAGRSSVQVAMRGNGDLQQASREVQSLLEAIGTVPSHAITQPAPQDVILVQLFGGATRASDGLMVRGQVMTASPQTRAAAKKAVLEGVANLAIPNVVLEAEFDDQFMAGVTNDPDLVARAASAMESLGDEVELLTVSNVIPAFSEDFGSFQYLAPGVMFFLGVSNPETGTVGMPHTGSYVADDAAIAVGVKALSAVLLERLLN